MVGVAHSALTVALERAVRNEPIGDALRSSCIGPSGALALADTLRSAGRATLARLDLYGCALSDEGCEAMLHTLADRGACASLDLGANGAGKAAATALAPLLRLRAGAEDEGGGGLAHGGGLVELRLARNELSGEALAAMLTPAAAPTAKLLLRCLALAFNPLGAAGGEAIGAALRAGRLGALSSLQLASCELGPTGVAGLARGLRDARSLVHLDLSDNRAADEGAAAVAAEAASSRIAELIFARNGCGDATGETFAAALQRERRCPLKLLCLASNRLRDRAATALAGALGAPAPRGNRSLEILDLSGNRLSAAAVLSLGDALVVNHSVNSRVSGLPQHSYIYFAA